MGEKLTLFNKIFFCTFHYVLFVSILLSVTLYPDGPSPLSAQPTSCGINMQISCCISCAFSRCFTAAPCMTPAVRFDNAEHLPLSPSATNQSGDLFPPFICNVRSMYPLLVTELEKLVEATVWRTHRDFWGIIACQLEPEKTSFSSQCQS